MNEQLEQFIQSVPAIGEPVEIPPELLPAPAPAFSTVRAQVGELAGEGAEFEAPPPTPQIMDLSTFRGQWVLYHQMLGGMVAMRSGVPCPLADQAGSEGGLMAADAAYELISRNALLSKMILSESSTFFGQLSVVGAHGFACVQLVKASLDQTQNSDRDEVLEHED